MKCAWNAYTNLLPHWMRQQVDELGQDALEELRLHIGLEPELVLHQENINLPKITTNDDIAFVINAASAYSPWTANSVAQGYLTAPGGHRIGICGVSTVINGIMTGISQPTSLCIRVARDFENIAKTAANVEDSILIIGPPGSGKTTLLRDLIRMKSQNESIAVVDERGELFPLHKGQASFFAGNRTDILSGCPKSYGVEAVLRSMNPRWIAVDEITAPADCEALLHAGWCGVKLLATAHAGSLLDLKSRPVYQPLINTNLFPTVIILRKDKSWTMERLSL